MDWTVVDALALASSVGPPSRLWVNRTISPSGVLPSSYLVSTRISPASMRRCRAMAARLKGSYWQR